MKVRHQSIRRRPAGFTLIEILVSSAVLSIVMAVMFAALSTSLSLWRNTDNKIVADREARAVESLLARDLGSVVIPRDPALWPRLRTGPGSAVYFGFLTLSPAEMQSAAADEVGDVCYVEYAVLPSTNGGGLEVRRLFWPSAKTFSDILSSGSLPGIQSANQFESLGLNLLPTNSMAARGLGPLATEVSKTNFILLGTNMLPLVGSPGLNNYPAAIEVNLAVADPDTLANSNIIASDKYILRNAGLYSFRIPLPKPPDVP